MKKPQLPVAQKKSQQGATMLEYGIIVALIVVGAIAFLPDIGTAIKGAFSSLATELTPPPAGQ